MGQWYDTSTNWYNSEYATLIYYNNVSSGGANNTAGYAYYADSSSNAYGPVTAIAQLPTTTQWSNVNLYTTTRNIQYETGTTVKSDFSYEGYAARLLTYQEVERGCYDGTTAITSESGLSSKCKFLYENTLYSTSGLKNGYWLETAYTSNSNIVWSLYGFYRFVDGVGVIITAPNGVRPAIEVAKTNISY